MCLSDRDRRDGTPPDRLISRIFESALMIAVSGYLIKLGICCFLQVWRVVAILLALAGGCIILWRIWKNRHDTKW